MNPVNTRDASEIERIAGFARSANDGLIVTGSPSATSSRSDHHACGPAQAASGLLFALLRCQRWPDLLSAG